MLNIEGRELRISKATRNLFFLRILGSVTSENALYFEHSLKYWYMYTDSNNNGISWLHLMP